MTVVDESVLTLTLRVTVGVTVQCQQLQNRLLDCRGQHRSCQTINQSY